VVRLGWSTRTWPATPVQRSRMVTVPALTGNIAVVAKGKSEEAVVNTCAKGGVMARVLETPQDAWWIPANTVRNVPLAIAIMRPGAGNWHDR
jgi:hypothetical protein